MIPSADASPRATRLCQRSARSTKGGPAKRARRRRGRGVCDVLGAHRRAAARAVARQSRCRGIVPVHSEGMRRLSGHAIGDGVVISVTEHRHDLLHERDRVGRPTTREELIGNVGSHRPCSVRLPREDVSVRSRQRVHLEKRHLPPRPRVLGTLEKERSGLGELFRLEELRATNDVVVGKHQNHLRQVQWSDPGVFRPVEQRRRHRRATVRPAGSHYRW